MSKMEEHAQKIAILGVSNAGKTSIVKILTREFEMLTIVKPTLGIERSILEIFGNEVIIWDFGGQEMYREKYLQQSQRYFEDIAYIFYVIDIQDPTLLGENIMYFQAIHRKILQYSPEATFVVLFHKLDPDIGRPPHVDDLQDKFLEGIESDNVNLSMYYTSIYNPFSIIQAFSQPLFDKKEIQASLNQVFASFDENYKILFTSLISNNSFEIAYHKSNRFEEKYAGQFPNIFKEVFYKIDKKLDENRDYDLDVNQINIIYSKFTFTDINEMHGYLFLILAYDNEAMLEKEGLNVALDRLKANLRKIIKAIDFNEVLQLIKS